MSMTIFLVALAAVVFFLVVFLAVNAAGTRLTGKQIDEDPDVRRHVDESQRNDDFPIDADY